MLGDKPARTERRQACRQEKKMAGLAGRGKGRVGRQKGRQGWQAERKAGLAGRGKGRVGRQKGHEQETMGG
ncbi:hypothetical protein Pmani_031482 [Petrolisthes manimaculis]|uniref:Uncharacterized protein n=1 Tax=Petrolisthes manimaculis TaxID=1843537 RepID=A0AAE1NVA0_9EUCA|nr:hypothetical protein Pmani_031482 [Petrolisthes manimaculis]